MPDIKPIIFHYDEGEMHVVRRLGGAVLAQWTDLPSDVQKRLVDQAIFVHDPDLNVQVHQQINGLIRKHNPNWDGTDA
jgi:hypothetical protein